MERCSGSQKINKNWICLQNPLFNGLMLSSASRCASESVYWYNKGVDLSKLGKYSEALAAFDKVIEINPQYPG